MWFFAVHILDKFVIFLRVFVHNVFDAVQLVRPRACVYLSLSVRYLISICLLSMSVDWDIQHQSMNRFLMISFLLHENSLEHYDIPQQLFVFLIEPNKTRRWSKQVSTKKTNLLCLFGNIIVRSCTFYTTTKCFCKSS